MSHAETVSYIMGGEEVSCKGCCLHPVSSPSFLPRGTTHVQARYFSHATCPLRRAAPPRECPAALPGLAPPPGTTQGAAGTLMKFGGPGMSSPLSSGPAFPPTWCQAALRPLPG